MAQQESSDAVLDQIIDSFLNIAAVKQRVVAKLAADIAQRDQTNLQ